MKSGSAIAEALFKAMGGKGGIVALGGIISTTAAIERKKGLDQALAAHPDVKLLDFQVANFKSTEAYDLTSSLLTRFGDQIKGIWAANDDMGTGALEALRGEGLAGKVPVVGIDGIKAAIDAVKSGEYAATITSDPFWQGGMGLSIGYHAYTKSLRRRQGAQGTPRVLRPHDDDHEGQRGRLHQDQRRQPARDRLERRLGPLRGADPVELNSGRPRVLDDVPSTVPDRDMTSKSEASALPS